MGIFFRASPSRSRHARPRAVVVPLVLVAGAFSLVAALCCEEAFVGILPERRAQRPGRAKLRSGRFWSRQVTVRLHAIGGISEPAVAEVATNFPAISVVVAAAAASSAFQLSRAFSTPDLDGEEGFFNSRRWSGRTVTIALSWLLLLGYALLLAPGKGVEAAEADKVLLGQILSTPFDGSVPAVFVCIFNMLGIWPAIYAATLLPGADRQSPVPAFPFVAGSFFIGAFAVSPYLAVREYRGTPGDSGAVDWATENLLESRFTAVLLLAGATYLALYALGNGTIGNFALAEAWSGFLPLFMGSLTAHVSSVDFMVLWMFYAPVLLEDGRRRGCFQGPPSSWQGADVARFVLGAGLPVFGGVFWMLLRPPLPTEQRPLA